MMNYKNIWFDKNKLTDGDRETVLVLSDFENNIKNQIISTGFSMKDREHYAFEKVNNHKDMDLFVYWFYDYILEHGKIPSQSEYRNHYLDNVKWKNVIYNRENRPFRKIYWETRLERNYMSIVRDCHLYLMVYESKKFDNVFYSIKQDIEDKLDLVVEKNKIKLGLKLFTDTENAERELKRKERVESKFHIKEKQGFDSVVCKICLENCASDKIRLYSSDVIQTIQSEISKKLVDNPMLEIVRGLRKC